MSSHYLEATARFGYLTVRVCDNEGDGEGSEGGNVAASSPPPLPDLHSPSLCLSRETRARVFHFTKDARGDGEWTATAEYDGDVASYADLSAWVRGLRGTRNH